MKIAIFFILIVTGAVASSVTEESSNRIVKDSNLRGSVSIVEGAFQEQLEEKRDGNVKFMKDNEYAVQKDEEEDMAHQVAAKLVKDNEYEVQKAEEAKDLDSEPQGLEELVSRCFCAGSNNALCCGGICGPPDDGLCIYRRSQKPPL